MSVTFRALVPDEHVTSKHEPCLCAQSSPWWCDALRAGAALGATEIEWS